MNENVLLIGETGTGKTSILQRMALELNKELLIINMSTQSEVSDLIGGFKPLDISILIQPLLKEFLILFEKTVSKKGNEGFLDTLRMMVKRRRWKKVVDGFFKGVEVARRLAKTNNTNVVSVVSSTTTTERSGSIEETNFTTVGSTTSEASILKKETATKGSHTSEASILLLIIDTTTTKNTTTTNNNTNTTKDNNTSTSKRRKVIDPQVFIEWQEFATRVHQFQKTLSSPLQVSFVEGILVKALKSGSWILLDEINLATPETLSSIASVFQGGSLTLFENGDTEPIKRHEQFRLFGCMNPSTDAGKKPLPDYISSTFTQFWIDPPSSKQDLSMIISSCLGNWALGPSGSELVNNLFLFFSKVKKLSNDGMIFDGASVRVHISLRTLTRALRFAYCVAPMYGLKRAIYEGVTMTFLTGLNDSSFQKVNKLVHEYILGTTSLKSLMNYIPTGNEDTHVLVCGFWIEKGPVDVEECDGFVLTPSVMTNLTNLARGCLLRQYPVLIQGPTSAGKTSMVEYLARKTGHRFIRINNHEHTDLQEYLGGYMTNDVGSLVFQEGVLVEALRKGYWVVLDELNLAPSDVLEALNRLLDDNRELFLPEKQEVIKPHPQFMLFATQNPAGQYGGRKQLSKAFRNRFLELHFGDIPQHELETIIEKRCLIPPSYAKKLTSVYRALCQMRDASKVFDGRASFITLRDLFRWAMRKASGYQRLAEDGYMLIAERVRKPDDRKLIQQILETELKVKLDMESRYVSLFEEIMKPIREQPLLRDVVSSVVWTTQMKKLFVLIYTCKQFSEPVLLIGETGCGKTTVCQVLASICHQQLHIVNAHQNSETSDFLGSQRPARNREMHELKLKEMVVKVCEEVGYDPQSDVRDMDVGAIETLVEKLQRLYPGHEETCKQIQKLIVKAKNLFEWYDGPLVQAMLQGDFFLLDEISLADDSVLERLNSVLEPSRQLTLVEKSGDDVTEITAADSFHFFATMNPGGDYGKKELSPALRNRFTEIWVPQVSALHDLQLIIEMKLQGLPDCNFWASKILEFLVWFASELGKNLDTIVSLRDILAWANFLKSLSVEIGVEMAFIHGGCMVLVDGIGVNPLFGALKSVSDLARASRDKLFDLSGLKNCSSELDNIKLIMNDRSFGAPPFVIPFGNKPPANVRFSLEAPTTLQNCLRVLRAVQLKKPVLLEGSPGAGKTSLVSSIAAMSRHGLVRINLSEQTDLMDLFGSDLPVEGGSGGEFAWRDGPFLKAMQEGEWVLLDELNLASQQVLEGLNACLDHRATVYIPELDKHFPCHPEFRVFAAQNPQSQGGGRKGLPKSFVNRFTLVYVDELHELDLKTIIHQLYPALDSDLCNKMIDFNQQLKVQTMDLRNFGWLGSPWEFNLRDVLRWIDLWKSNPHTEPSEFVKTIYIQRMRSKEDRLAVLEIFKNVFGYLPRNLGTPAIRISPEYLIVGSQVHKRSNRRGLHKYGIPTDNLELLPSLISTLESLLHCVKSNTMGLLVGPVASGKSSLVRLLASLCGEKLEEYSMNPNVDALEILGGFEQVDLVRYQKRILDSIEDMVEEVVRQLLLNGSSFDSVSRLTQWIRTIKASQGTHAVELMTQLLDTLNSTGTVPSSDIADLHSHIAAYRNYVETDVRGRFEWMDSTLVRALERGHWILIDNVNLCSSSVLDRLNSLLEVGGSLVMNERGMVNGEIKIVKPHPNFRIFMALDPKHGEISRAMRNRAIELFLPDFTEESDTVQFNAMKLLTGMGLPGMHFASKFESVASLTQYRMLAEKLRHGLVQESMMELDIPNENVLDYLRFPTSFPDYVSGTMLVNASTIGTTLQEGALLFHLMLGSRYDFVSKSVVPQVPPTNALLDEAMKWFLRGLTPSNMDLLQGWFSFANELCPKPELSRFLEIVSSDDPNQLRDIMSCRNELLRRRNLLELSQTLPIDLRRSPIEFHTHVQLFTEFTQKVDKLYVCRQGRLLKQKMQSVYNAAESVRMSRPTIAQSSFLVHMRKLRVASLHHEGIQFLYPLMETLTNAVLSETDLELDIAKRLLNVTIDIWDSVQGYYLDFNLITVLFKRLTKILGSWSNFSKSLLDIANSVTQAFNLNRLEANSKLWKTCSTMSLIHQPLWDVAKGLENIDDQMNFWLMNPQDWFHVASNNLNWMEKKKMIVEAMSTLYFLNDQTEMDLKLFDVIKTVPEKLNLSAHSGEDSVVNLQSLNEAQQVCKQFLLWPVNDFNTLSKELEVIYKLLISMTEGSNRDIGELKEMLNSFLVESIRTSSLSPLHFEPFQRLLWFFDSENLKVSGESTTTFLKTILQNAILVWHKGLWRNGHAFWNTHLHNEQLKSLINGEIAPLVYKEISFDLADMNDSLYLPILSGQSGIYLSLLRKMDDVPIYSVDSKYEQLKKTLEITSFSKHNTEKLLEFDTKILKYTATEFFQSYVSVLGSDKVHALNSAIISSEKADLIAAGHFIKGLSNQIWTNDVQNLILELLQLFGNIKSGIKGSKGTGWVCYALIFLHTYIPEFPFDPVESRKAKVSFLEKAFDTEVASLMVDLENEYLQKGSMNVATRQAQITSIDEMVRQCKKWKYKLPLRPEASQITPLFEELNGLKNNIAGIGKLTRMVQDLSSADQNIQSFAKETERTLQNTLDSLMKKWESSYAYYHDLLGPIYTAIYQLKFGLRALQSESHNTQHSYSNQILVMLTDFMSFLPESPVQLVGNGAYSCLDLDIRLALIRRMTFEKTSISRQHLEAFITLFGDIAEDWALAEEQKRKKLMESESIYKAKEVQIQTQDDLDEERFKELFPDYFEDFADLEPIVDSSDRDAEPKKKHESVSTIYTPKKAVEILNVFLTVSDVFSNQEVKPTKEFWKEVFSNSIEVGSALLASSKLVPSVSLDASAKPGLIFMNAFKIQEIESSAVSNAVYDFYNDPNIFEAQRIKPVLLQYESKLNVALSQWPEHDILVNLSTICKRLISFPVTSPIIKLLVGLELLLLKSHDWEQHASREYSLKAELDMVIKVIVSWRKLELDTWKQLLEIESRKCADGVSSQWYHLWKIVIRSVQSEFNGEVDNELLKGVLESLDQFCMNSTIGDYQARLKMLSGFKQFVDSIATNHGFTQQPQISALLSNVVGYYSQFVPAVVGEIENLKKPILKELKDYVKIASWKDVNVFALKESAKRTHYHLHKFVKKYRLGLQMKCNEVMMRFHENPPSVPGNSLELSVVVDKFNGLQSRFHSSHQNFAFDQFVVESSGLKRLPVVNKLYTKARAIAGQVIQTSRSLETCKNMDELVTEMVTQVKEFQSMNSSLQAGTQNAKGQKMIRKKLWVDFLKLLEYVGLNPRTNPKYAKMQDAFYLHSRSTFEVQSLLQSLKGLNASSHISETLQKSVSYHYRNIARLEVVRKLRVEFSPDITRLEMEKAVSFLDHLLDCSIAQRETLCGVDLLLQRVKPFVDQLQDSFTSGLTFTSRNNHRSLQYWNMVLQHVIVKSEKSLMVLNSIPIRGAVHSSLVRILSASLESLRTVSVDPCKPAMLPLTTILEQLSRAQSLISDLREKLYGFRSCELGYAIQSLMDTLDSVIDPTAESGTCSISDFEMSSEKALEKTLIVIQHLSKQDPTFEEDPDNQYNLAKKEITRSNDQFLDIFSLSALGEWIGAIETLITTVAFLNVPSKTVEGSLKAVYTLVDQAYLLLQYRVYQLIVFHKTWTKFAYLISNNFYLIIKNGFCVPKTAEEEEEGDTEEQVDGTGIGEGVGSKDVSNEIEEQEQVESLQNEQEQPPDPDAGIKEEKEGIEMDNDFDGKMEDVEANDEEEGDENEEREDQEPEEQMGNVDQDVADTVDEKLWGEEDSKGKDEKTEKDSSVEQGGGENEIAAKEDEDESQDKESEKEKPNDKKVEKENRADDEQDGPINEEDNFEENHGVDVKPPDELGNDLDDNEMEDLPDNLEFDDNGDEEDQENDRMDLDDDAEEPKGESSDLEMEQDEAVDPMTGPDPEHDEAEVNVDEIQEPETGDQLEEPETSDQVGNQEEEEGLNSEKGDDAEAEDIAPEHGHGYGEPEPEPEIEDQVKQEESETNNTLDIAQAPENPGTEGDNGQQNTVLQPDENEEGPGSGQQAQVDSSGKASQQVGEKSSQPEIEEERPSQNQSSAMESNPHRSVGNAMEKWLSRLKNITDSQSVQEETQEKPLDGAQGEDYEFVREDDEDQGDEQALGVADKDQAERMEKLALNSEEENEETNPVNDEMDLDRPENESLSHEQSQVQRQKDIKGNSTLERELESDTDDDDPKDDQKWSKPDNEKVVDEYKYPLIEPTGNDNEDVDMHVEEELEVLDYDTFRLALEKRMAEWRQAGQDLKESQELWRNYSLLTRDLAFSLCEQLRLILEPTLSTKLKGDYRTGKRLNMRKIIPYIASQFKKDKIWLRRTKPSKRTYQIMIAIDDSLSMASSHSVQLAFESLTAITTALNQLEAGDLAILGFGEDVKLVHPFEKSWSDEAGAQVLQSFTFAQERTHVKMLLDQSLEIFRHAKMMQSSAADLWQLEIILSDGICQDHDYIKTRVNLAAEEHIAVVFIILDTRSDSESILTMNDVSFETDPVTHMPVLKMNRYMDTFPFDYYVIVRNVETLPQVLSDILRQFFMFIAS